MALSANSGGRGGGRRRRKQALTEINVTPLVDVMLVLLIIFMISAPLLTSGVELKLPKTEAAALQPPKKPLTVSIQQSGQVYVQDEPAELVEVAPRLKAMAEGDLERTIYVRADGRVAYDVVAKVVAKLSGAGFTRLSLVTDTANTPIVRGGAN